MNRIELQGWCQDAADELNEIYSILESGALNDAFVQELTLLRALCQDILTEGKDIKNELSENARCSSFGDENAEHRLSLRELI